MLLFPLLLFALVVCLGEMVSFTENNGTNKIGHQSINLMQMKKRIFFPLFSCRTSTMKGASILLFSLLVFKLLVFLLLGSSLYFGSESIYFMQMPDTSSCRSNWDTGGRKRKSEVELVWLILKNVFVLKWRETEFFILGQMQSFWCVKIVYSDVTEANCVDIWKIHLFPFPRESEVLRTGPGAMFCVPLCTGAALAWTEGTVQGFHSCWRDCEASS